MARRTLIEGLKSLDEDIDPDLAEEFINPKPRPPAKKSTAAPKVAPKETEELPSPPPLWPRWAWLFTRMATRRRRSSFRLTNPWQRRTHFHSQQ
jgi:hypothetical protein